MSWLPHFYICKTALSDDRGPDAEGVTFGFGWVRLVAELTFCLRARS